jgi:hypothetical protein
VLWSLYKLREARRAIPATACEVGGYTVSSKEANTIKFLMEVTAAIVVVAFVIAVVVFWPYRPSK